MPIVRTFAPVAAGVGHMNYRRYSLYNAIGAFIWGSGLTFAGYLLGYIPTAVANFVDRVHRPAPARARCSLAVIPTVFHYIRSAAAPARRREHD